MSRSQIIFTLRFAAASFIYAVGILAVAHAAHAQISGLRKTVKPVLADEEQKFVQGFVAESAHLQQQLETAKALGDARGELRILQQLGKLVSDANKAYPTAGPEENAVDFCKEPPRGKGVCSSPYYCKDTAGPGDPPRLETCITVGELAAYRNIPVRSDDNPGGLICDGAATYVNRDSSCWCGAVCNNGKLEISAGPGCIVGNEGAGGVATGKVIGGTGKDTGKGIGTRKVSISPQKIAEAINAAGKSVTLATGETLAYSPKTKKLMLSDDGFKRTSFAPPKKKGRGGIVVPLTPTTGVPPTQPPAGRAAALFDFGDIYDQTTLAQRGVHHRIGGVWLGGAPQAAAVDAEADAKRPDSDLFDDGLALIRAAVVPPPPDTVRVTRAPAPQGKKPLSAAYLNVLDDANGNGRWEPNEWVVQNQLVRFTTGDTQTVSLQNPSNKPVVLSRNGGVRITVSLQKLQNYRGLAPKNLPLSGGETEDYLFGQKGGVPPICPALPIPQCAEGMVSQTSKNAQGCPVTSCVPGGPTIDTGGLTPPNAGGRTPAPTGAPAPETAPAPTGGLKSSSASAPSFLGWLSRAFGS